VRIVMVRGRGVTLNRYGRGQWTGSAMAMPLARTL